MLTPRQRVSRINSMFLAKYAALGVSLWVGVFYKGMIDKFLNEKSFKQ